MKNQKSLPIEQYDPQMISRSFESAVLDISDCSLNNSKEIVDLESMPYGVKLL